MASCVKIQVHRSFYILLLSRNRIRSVRPYHWTQWIGKSIPNHWLLLENSAFTHKKNYDYKRNVNTFFHFHSLLVLFSPRLLFFWIHIHLNFFYEQFQCFITEPPLNFLTSRTILIYKPMPFVVISWASVQFSMSIIKRMRKKKNSNCTERKIPSKMYWLHQWKKKKKWWRRSWV